NAHSFEFLLDGRGSVPRGGRTSLAVRPILRLRESRSSRQLSRTRTLLRTLGRRRACWVRSAIVASGPDAHRNQARRRQVDEGGFQQTGRPAIVLGALG